MVEPCRFVTINHKLYQQTQWKAVVMLYRLSSKNQLRLTSLTMPRRGKEDVQSLDEQISKAVTGLLRYDVAFQSQCLNRDRFAALRSLHKKLGFEMKDLMRAIPNSIDSDGETRFLLRQYWNYTTNRWSRWVRVRHEESRKTREGKLNNTQYPPASSCEEAWQGKDQQTERHEEPHDIGQEENREEPCLHREDPCQEVSNQEDSQEESRQESSWHKPRQEESRKESWHNTRTPPTSSLEEPWQDKEQQKERHEEQQKVDPEDCREKYQKQPWEEPWLHAEYPCQKASWQKASQEESRRESSWHKREQEDSQE